MESEVVKMLVIIATGWAITFALRALPFVAFSGGGRPAPKWAERFGVIASPVIIAALIVYSYSGLEWRTAWPYLAGVVTIAFQLWRRNPLLSIMAGTVFYMTMLSCGCTTTVYRVDAHHPAVGITPYGVEFGDRRVRAHEVPAILAKHGVPHDRTIHIHVDSRVRDLSEAKFLMACLAKNGYTRPVLVTDRHAEARAKGKVPPPSAGWSRDDTPDPPPKKSGATRRSVPSKGNPR